MESPDRAEKNPVCAAIVDFLVVGRHCFFLWVSEINERTRTAREQMCLIAGEGKILAEGIGRVPDCRQARENRKREVEET